MHQWNCTVYSTFEYLYIRNIWKANSWLHYKIITINTYLLIVDNVAWLFWQQELEKLGHMLKVKVFKPYVLTTMVIIYLQPEMKPGPRSIFEIKLLKMLVYSLNLLPVFVKTPSEMFGKGPESVSGWSRPKYFSTKPMGFFNPKQVTFMF